MRVPKTRPGSTLAPAYLIQKSAATAKLKIQYYRSAIGFAERQKLIVKGLGFTKLNATRELVDNSEPLLLLSVERESSKEKPPFPSRNQCPLP